MEIFTAGIYMRMGECECGCILTDSAQSTPTHTPLLFQRVIYRVISQRLMKMRTKTIRISRLHLTVAGWPLSILLSATRKKRRLFCYQKNMMIKYCKGVATQYAILLIHFVFSLIFFSRQQQK